MTVRAQLTTAESLSEGPVPMLQTRIARYLRSNSMLKLGAVYHAFTKTIGPLLIRPWLLRSDVYKPTDTLTKTIGFAAMG